MRIVPVERKSVMRSALCGGFGLILLIALQCTGPGGRTAEDVGDSSFQAGGLTDSGAETTLRNATETPVTYAVKVHRADEVAEEKTLQPGEIDKFTGDRPLDVSYPKSASVMTVEIKPGAPYTFRHNENGELELYPGSHGRADAVDLAPFVSTPYEIVDRMLEMARVKSTDVVYDIGCGDGRIVIQAALDYGARGVGIDIVPERIMESRASAKTADVEELVEFRLEDATKSDLTGATIVTLYLVPESMKLLRPLLEKKLNYGTTVVSHGYPITGWEDRIFDYAVMTTEEGATHVIYVYRW